MDARTLFTRSVIMLSLCAVAGYAYFEARPFLSGPEVIVSEPADGFVVTESPVAVSGSAHRISEITLNGNPIFVDESGRFEQLVPLSPGYSVLEVAVRDRYGRQKSVHIRGLYRPDALYETPPLSITATTSERTSSSTDDSETPVSVDETASGDAL